MSAGRIRGRTRKNIVSLTLFFHFESWKAILADAVSEVASAMILGKLWKPTLIISNWMHHFWKLIEVMVILSWNDKLFIIISEKSVGRNICSGCATHLAIMHILILIQRVQDIWAIINQKWIKTNIFGLASTST